MSAGRRYDAPPALVALAEAVARDAGDEKIYAAAAATAAELIGYKLFTIMAYDAAAIQIQRLYSSNPRVYPPGRSKAKGGSEWGRQVLQAGRPFIGQDAAAIAAHFDDHELILSLGLGSVLNLPLRCRGRVVGTMNLLNVAGFYEESDIDRGLLIATLLATVVGRSDRVPT